MELLTTQGWNAAYSVEAVIVQMANILVSGNARIPPQNKVILESFSTILFIIF